MSYYEMKDAKVRIADELRVRGWKVYGYKEDESDSMTDYYNPAHWNGIATKNGYTLIIDNSTPYYSNQEITKYNPSKAISKDDREKISKLENMTIERGCTQGEEDNAKKLIENIKAKTPNNNSPYEVIDQYPEYMGNPGKSKWHIEKNGSMYDKGTGITKYSSVPSQHTFDINKMEYKQGYTHWNNWSHEERKEKVLSDEERKLISEFKSLVLKWDRIVNGDNSCGDGTKETADQAVEQSKPLEKVIIKETRTVLKMVELERKNILVGDYISISYHGGFWKVTDQAMRSGTWKVNGEKVTEERNTFSYEEVATQKRKYQELKNGKRYYQWENSIIKDINDGKIKIYELKEVEEVFEVEKYINTNKKVTKPTKTTTKKETPKETQEENKTSNIPNVSITDPTVSSHETPPQETTPTQQENNIIITLNDEKNGIEIKFPSKPSEEIRQKLKDHSFRWHSVKMVWYAKQSQERLEFAQALQLNNSNIINNSDFSHNSDTVSVQEVEEKQAEQQTNNKNTLLEKINTNILSLESKIENLKGDYLTNTWKRQQEQTSRDMKINSYDIDIKLLLHVAEKLNNNETITPLEENLIIASFRNEIHSHYIMKYGRCQQDPKIPQVNYSYDKNNQYNLDVPKRQARLKKAEITNNNQLLAAVEEYKIIYDSIDRYVDPIEQKIKKLTNQYKMLQKGDFHITDNKQLLEQLMDLADIKQGEKVLEPSAGLGSICDKLKEYTDIKNIDTCEYMFSYGELLKLKGYNVKCNDFLELDNYNYYDKIVANVPFSVEQEHIKHIYDMLKVGGKAVIITSPHYTFASDNKSKEFRNWLDGLTYEMVDVPEKSFSHTNVNAKILIIEKEAEVFQKAI